jgi:hypothetical protein
MKNSRFRKQEGLLFFDAGLHFAALVLTQSLLK